MNSSIRADDPGARGGRLQPTTSGQAGETSSDPAVVLRRFVSDARAGDFESLWSHLSADLRTRYDGSTLAEEHGSVSDMVARDLSEIERALDQGGLTVLDGETEALLPLGQGRAVRLVKETGGWRIASLH